MQILVLSGTSFPVDMIVEDALRNKVRTGDTSFVRSEHLLANRRLRLAIGRSPGETAVRE
jgi:hypothetical protein